MGDTFDPISNVKAIDKEDGDLTTRVKHKGDVDTSKPGKYIVDYSVIDSQGGNATATQTVIVGKWRNSRFKTYINSSCCSDNYCRRFIRSMAKVKAIDKETAILLLK